MSDATSRGRFARAASEFVLIVAGVSVALAADSLWDFRQDRAAEREYLAQLRADLTENETRLVAALDLERQQAQAAQRALDALATGGPIAPDSAQLWLMEERGLFYSDPRPITGTLSALVQTGDLRLIRDLETRNALVSYLAQITADKTEFDRFVDESLTGIRMLRASGAAPAVAWGELGDAAIRGFLRRPVPTDAPIALEHIITASELRQVYLTRMLEATEATARALDQAG